MEKQRSRLSKACTFCKARKRKCDGQQPCSFCRVKGNVNCSYDILDKRSIRYSPWKKKSTSNRNQDGQVSSVDGTQRHVRTSTEQPTIDSSSCVMDGLYNPVDDTSRDLIANDGVLKENRGTLIPEDTGSTLMPMDTQGSMRFIGESSPLSLLQQTRKIFSDIGMFKLSDSKFVNDPRRFNIVDVPDTPTMQDVSVPLPRREKCDDIVALYLSNSSQLVYVFKEGHLKNVIVEKIYQDPTNASLRDLCQLYIVLAIGSVYSKTITRDGNEYHVKYFKSAMNILNSSTQNCNVWFVEVYLLITLYYQVACKRNTSWINLGTAIRIAESIGLNRRKINDSYSDKDHAIHRRKLWRSLYTMDRLTSISLGRPLGINNIIWDDNRNSVPISTSGPLNLRDVCESQLVKLCDLNGEIYESVYYSGKIDSKIAYGLAMRLKHWCMSLPPLLQAENLLELNNLDTLDKEKLHMERYHHHPLLLLHLTHFNGVILLSRPFFHYYITKTLNETLEAIKSNSVTTPPPSNEVTIIKQFADSCVNASVFTVKFSWFYIKNNIHPLKPYNMINNIFNSGLILALVTLLEILQSYGSSDGKEKIKNGTHLESLGYGIQILKEFSQVDSLAMRYKDILEDVEDALTDVMSGCFGDLDVNDTSTNDGVEPESPTSGAGEVIEKLNDLDDWLFGSIFGGNEGDRLMMGSGELDSSVNATGECDLLNAFMHNLNNTNNGDILFDNTF